MKVIPITLRSSPDVLLPVVIRNLKVRRRMSAGMHEIGITPDTVVLSLTRSLTARESQIGVATDNMKLNAVKNISISHDIGVTSTVRPLILAEIECEDNVIGIDASAAEVRFSRYRKLEEVDAMSLSALDTMALEEVDYIES